MKRKYMIVGLLLCMSFFGGTILAESLPSAGSSENGTESLQVPHKPKGTKTRLGAQAQGGRPAEKKVETTKPQTGKKGGEVRKAVKKQTFDPSSRYVAVKTNAVYWAGAIMNLSAEVQLHEHVSLELPFNWSLWDIEQEHGVRLVLFQPEARWWMKGVGKGHFVGVHAHVGAFNVKWKDDRFQSTERPVLGAGFTYGYSLPFSEHWGAEFLIGAGYANMKYNQYYNIDNGAQIGKKSYNYWGITRIGASLVYRF
ncbi:DUF3575 domain-containing protein [Bacteroides sp. ET225]